jgi:hypothetical protein
LSPIVIDTSAILAILRDEAERDAFLETILAAWPRLMSAVNLQELGMVIAGHTGGERTWVPGCTWPKAVRYTSGPSAEPAGLRSRSAINLVKAGSAWVFSQVAVMLLPSSNARLT